jgi:hypothetical protein
MSFVDLVQRTFLRWPAFFGDGEEDGDGDGVGLAGFLVSTVNIAIILKDLQVGGRIIG